ncbi:hypothetical protein GPECTOR_14g276 [Gonium pectorale]|uniref:Uncharacterized protein n=1 Tax=Gonium pectorale TaxID=33097 RepID=A0A150GMK8_GONPE|nr:hypothetical protein GPECTOR_14g276 [Gonium pectorale]|eukprot:KXZ51037.1 hypothetical protein GPECTOR_14g276 [Gonium pectorale]
MFDRIKYLHKEELDTRFLITGTPGIGKTCLAVPLMGWLIQEGMASKIVYETNRVRYLVTAVSSGVISVEQGSTLDFEQELDDTDDDDVWWIVDTGEVLERRANTVLLAPPDRKQYHEFLKLHRSVKLYMPVWTDDEIADCSGPHASHMLLHIEVLGPEYGSATVKVASPYVVRKLEEKAGDAHVQRLKDMSLVFSAYAAAAGTFFQSYAHRRLQQGGSFKVRRLSSPQLGQQVQPTTLELLQGPCTAGVHVFTKLDEVRQQGDGVYCLPSSVHNIPAVDAIMQPDSLFQMTIAQKKAINENGLRTAVRQLRGTAKRIEFAVPPSVFEAYCLVSGVSEDVEQWVLEVPWV